MSDNDGSKFNPITGGGTGPDSNVKGKVLIGSMDDTSLYVEAQYNPKELEVGKQVPWSKTNESNRSNQKSDQNQGIHMEFTGAEGRSLSLDLLFDSYETNDGKVAEAVSTLEKLASVRQPGSSKEELKRPHRCMVVWGSVIRMSCVIENLSTKYTMFSKDGVPLRAQCTVKLKEADVVSTKKQGR